MVVRGGDLFAGVTGAAGFIIPVDYIKYLQFHQLLYF